MSFELLLVVIVLLIIFAVCEFSLFKKSKNIEALKNQFCKDIPTVISKELQIFREHISINEKSKIFVSPNIPIVNPNRWDKIPGIICCFVDMAGSTALSASVENDEKLAKIYRLFTETAIRIFNEFDSPYIDVKGDGVFALFNSDQAYTALAATISFKTFVYYYFTPKTMQATRKAVGGHFGIDQGDILVRKFGFKRAANRPDRQNEVWAGQPVNMAAKLSSLSSENQLWMSSRFFEGLDLEGLDSDFDWEIERKSLKHSGKSFSFDTAYVLCDNWSELHGRSHCQRLLALNEKLKTY
ncbi:adenylate/guanylate cyclase domain-containing protein [Egbenema bharatensis]|uniref:adenylate/guanylate cyclase domain-containing protein n=1 Tax=Egbenema bharatensis TaxID=3463334 RepID=UPI003A853910